MKKHLVCYSTDIYDPSAMFLNLSGWLYWKKRLQPWKWRLRRTMGRPVLTFWRKPNFTKNKEDK